MNYEREQIEEIEALSEIYFNEITVLSNQAPRSFSIKVRAQASNYEEQAAPNNSEDEEDSDDDQSDDRSIEEGLDQEGTLVEIQFDLPLKYPDEKPSMQILNSVNLSQHELEQLMVNLDRVAEESLGTVMVFTLVSDVVEWLVKKSDLEAIELEQEEEQRQKAVEAEETKRFDGTPVTEKTFLAWKAKFDAEILKAKLAEQRQKSEQGTTGPKGLTGRAMFEQDKTLAESDLNFVEDLDQNQIEALLHNLEEVDLDDEDFELDSNDDEEQTDSEDEGDDETDNSVSKR